MDLFSTLSGALDVGLVALGLILLSRWVALVVLSIVDVVARAVRPVASAPPSGHPWPTIAVLVPAYNEERVIEGTILSVLEGDYPALSVVVIDDGSADATWDKIEGWQARDSRVQGVMQRPNQGKAAALNTGIDEVDAEILVTVDADTVLERDALRRLVAPLLHDPRVGGVAGNIKVGNRQNLITVLQSIEYVTGLNLVRRAEHRLGCIMTAPGAATAWRRSAIVSVGGFSAETRVEDTDLTLAVQRAGWKVLYQPDAVAYTEAPSTWPGLVAQRTRWIWGFIQVAFKHRGGLFRHGTVGWLGLPDLIYRNILAFLLLPLIFPGLWRLVVAFSWWGLLELMIGLVALDLLASILSYVEDRERVAELIWVPLRRLIWPWFLAGVLVRVLWITARDGSVPWAKLGRTGTVARAAQEPSGPRVVRRR